MVAALALTAACSPGTSTSANSAATGGSTSGGGPASTSASAPGGTSATPSGASSGASTPAAASGASASKTLSADKITLTVTTTTPDDSTVAIAKSFEAAHPNVTVDVKPSGYDAYVAAEPLLLQSKSAPDLALVASIGNLAKDNLLLPLGKYAQSYGWNKRISASALAQGSVAADKVTLGGDQLLLFPVAYYAVGLYYNKAEAKAVGIASMPTTLDELTADLAKAKAAGKLPMQLGDKQGHAAFTIEEIAQSMVGAQPVNDWSFGKPGQTFDTPAFHKGVDTLLDWNAKGYLPSVGDINGTDLAGAVANFGKGQGVFFLDGNWDSGTIAKAMGSNVGFILFPGSHPVAAGGTITYAIPAHAKHPDEAAAFLDFFSSAAAAQPIYDSGVLPNDTSQLKIAPGTVGADIAAAFKTATTSPAGGLTEAVQNATSSMNNTFIQQTQELLAGKTNESAFFKAIQADWSAVHAR